MPVLGARKRSRPFIIDMFYPGRVACQPVGITNKPGSGSKYPSSILSLGCLIWRISLFTSSNAILKKEFIGGI
jgi:hypothetical protein